MSKSKRNKKKRVKRNSKKTPPLALKSILQEWWNEKHPVLIFVGKFVLILTLVHIIRYTSFFLDTGHPALTTANAYLAHLVLNVFQQGTIAQGAIIQSSSFSMSIVHGCDATEAVMIFISLVLAFPVEIAKRVLGVIVGTAFLLGINLLRVISLFLIGVYFKKWFEFAHIEAWQFIFILLSLAACALWIRWATKPLEAQQYD